MNRLLIALIGTGLLSLLFIFGLMIDAPGLVMPVVCLWTPLAWFTGYAFAGVGGRLRSPIEVGREF